MITIGNDDAFMEGIINDSLKSAANVDVNDIKDKWKDSSMKIRDKVKYTNDEGLGKLGDKLDEINKSVVKPNLADGRSIIARARNSVLQFPIYISQSIRVNEAHIIAKMFERVYTTLVQTVLSQNQYIDEEEANNLVFLKRFHTNITEAADVLKEEFYNKYFEAIDDIDQMVSDSVFLRQHITENCEVEFRWHPYKEEVLFAENSRLLNEPLSGLIYLREADEKKDDPTKESIKEASAKTTTLSEKDLEEMAMNETQFTREEKNLIKKSRKDISDEVKSMNIANDKKRNEFLVKRMRKKAAADEKLHRAVNSLKDKIKKGSLEKNGYFYNNGRFYRKDKTAKTVVRPKDMTPERALDAPKLLKDSDIKKVNGMLPYTIEATFRIKGKNGTIDRDVRYIIGIKSVLHLIRSQDIANDLRELITGNVKSLQKVRYKTGEIGFMDYMFNIKGIKADAAKHINYNKRWMNTLKRLGDFRKMNGSLLKHPIKLINGSVPIPNGTIVLSQADVSMLTNQTGIDISVVSNAKKLAKSLFLIAVVIVDASAGTMRVLFPDSDSSWDIQSLASIDAELSKTDNSQIMRELNRIVNK